MIDLDRVWIGIGILTITLVLTVLTVRAQQNEIQILYMDVIRIENRLDQLRSEFNQQHEILESYQASLQSVSATLELHNKFLEAQYSRVKAPVFRTSRDGRRICVANCGQVARGGDTK